jgi:hypothetical protein
VRESRQHIPQLGTCFNHVLIFRDPVGLKSLNLISLSCVDILLIEPQPNKWSKKNKDLFAVKHTYQTRTGISESGTSDHNDNYQMVTTGLYY